MSHTLSKHSNRVHKPIACAVFSITSIFVAMVWGDELEFATKDGQYTTRGTVESFINKNGQAIKLPRSLTAETRVIIKLLDGKTTLPIPLSQLSDKTQAAITSYLVQSRKSSPQSKRPIEKPSNHFLQNQQQLNVLLRHYSELGDLQTLQPGAKQQFLTDLLIYKNDLDGDASSDRLLRVSIAYLQAQCGENRYGELRSLAKETQEFWPAWEAAMISSLRYRESIIDCLRLMNQFLTELTTFARTHLDTANEARLKRAGRAALWLRETAAIIDNSELANESELKRLRQIQASSVLASLIKEGSITAEELKEAAERRRNFEAQKNAAEAELRRIEKLTLDKKVDECTQLLERFMDSYEKQWQYGVDAFDRQEIITREAQRKYQFAEQNRMSIARQTIEWKIRATRDLGEDPTEFAIREKRRAQETFNILSDQQDRAYYETKLSFNHFNFENQRLMQTHTILATFVNKGKNQMILFENQYLDSITADETLRRIYLAFTEKMKTIIAQFPKMPTVATPKHEDEKSGTRSLSQEQRANIKELSFEFSVDIEGFLTQLTEK